MSVVAWDGKTLAADCQATNHGFKWKSPKIFRLESGEVAAFTGQPDTGLLMLEWYRNGRKREEWPDSQTNDSWSRLIVAHLDKSVTVFEQFGFMQNFKDAPYMAWGAGRDFALGALAKGATAEEAVEIANQFSDSCGFGVESYEVFRNQLQVAGD